MSSTLQFKRGTTAQLSTVTGAVAELYINTTSNTVVVLDGITPGGFPAMSAASLTTSTSGSVLVSVAGNLPVFQNTLTLAGTTITVSPTTGALVVAGGAGIGDSLNVANTATVNVLNATTGTVGTLNVTNTATVNVLNATTGTVGTLGAITFKSASTTKYINTQTTGTYILSSTDSGNIIQWNTGTTATISIPGTIAPGFYCELVQTGNAQIIFTATSGAVIVTKNGADRTATQWSVASIRAINTSTTDATPYFVISGDISV